MPKNPYYAPVGGLPPQTQITTDRAMFTEAYAVIPKGTFSDIVTSFLPFWKGARFWVLSRPLSGFCRDILAIYRRTDPQWRLGQTRDGQHAQAVIFVVQGEVTLTIAGKVHVMGEGGYAYLPPHLTGRSATIGCACQVPLDSQSL